MLVVGNNDERVIREVIGLFFGLKWYSTGPPKYIYVEMKKGRA